MSQEVTQENAKQNLSSVLANLLQQVPIKKKKNWIFGRKSYANTKSFINKAGFDDNNLEINQYNSANITKFLKELIGEEALYDNFFATTEKYSTLSKEQKKKETSKMYKELPERLVTFSLAMDDYKKISSYLQDPGLFIDYNAYIHNIDTYIKNPLLSFPAAKDIKDKLIALRTRLDIEKLTNTNCDEMNSKDLFEELDSIMELRTQCRKNQNLLSKIDTIERKFLVACSAKLNKENIEIQYQEGDSRIEEVIIKLLSKVAETNKDIMDEIKVKYDSYYPYRVFDSSSQKQLFENDEKENAIAELNTDKSPNTDLYSRENFASITQKKNHLIKVIQPKNQLLSEIYDKYKEKYNIDIFSTFLEGNIYWNLEATPFIEKADERGITSFGVIVTGDLGTKSTTVHATPFLFFKENNTWGCVILDSVGSPLLSIKYKGETLKHHSSETIRQADNYSCRSDAILTLRNALLDIKLKKEKDPSFNVGDFIANYKTEENKALNRIYIQAPPQWTYHSQIFHPKPNESELQIANRHFSKKPEKREQIETIAQHRQKHTKQVKMEENLIFQTMDNRDIVKTKTKTRNINTEVLEKGRKLFDKSSIHNIAHSWRKTCLNRELQTKQGSEATISTQPESLEREQLEKSSKEDNRMVL